MSLQFLHLIGSTVQLLSHCIELFLVDFASREAFFKKVIWRGAVLRWFSGNDTEPSENERDDRDQNDNPSDHEDRPENHATRHRAVDDILIAETTLIVSLIRVGSRSWSGRNVEAWGKLSTRRSKPAPAATGRKASGEQDQIFITTIALGALVLIPLLVKVIAIRMRG